MKSVSIFEKRWIDLVFEGKNKSYGAYQLRQENSKTSIRAFFFGIVFVTAISGFGLLLSSFGKVPEEVIIKCPTVIIDKIYLNEPKPKVDEPKKEEKAETKKTAESILKKPIVAKIPDVESIKPAETNKVSNLPAGNDNTGGTTVLPTTVGGNDAGEGKKPFEGIAITGILDKQPEFPEGIEKFYKYVAQNFEKPEEIEGTIKVVVSFVIEPDGTMSNIRVARNPNDDMAVEAVRVLKSLKTKWVAGVIDGQKVRTAYSLPIVIQPN